MGNEMLWNHPSSALFDDAIIVAARGPSSMDARFLFRQGNGQRCSLTVRWGNGASTDVRAKPPINPARPIWTDLLWHLPVTVIHREENGTNQLDAARQTIRSLTATRERAERSLAEAQATIRDLQTKLMHERMSKDEAISRVSSENQATKRAAQSAQADLAAERAARRQAEAALAEAQVGSRDAERRLRDMVAAEHIDNPPQARPRGRPRKNAGSVGTTGPSGPRRYCGPAIDGTRAGRCYTRRQCSHAAVVGLLGGGLVQCPG